MNKLKHVEDQLKEFSTREDYAFFGQTGLYLQTASLGKGNPILFSSPKTLDVLTEETAPEKFGLSQFRAEILDNAEVIHYEGQNYRVAETEYLCLDGHLRKLPIADITTFLKFGGQVSPERIRSMLKSINRAEDFEQYFLPMFYDFMPGWKH
jgi:hypothetical protein